MPQREIGRRSLVLGFVLLAGCPATTPAPEAPPGPAVLGPVEVKYGPADGQVMDIYRPEKPFASPLPAVIHIHGGGWMFGDKEKLGPASRRLAALGMVVYAINYRLVRGKTNRWPTCWNDTHRALRWIIDNAADQGVDTERIAAVGYSAGGHLAALLGTRAETRLLLRGVVDFFGPADMRPQMEGARGPFVLFGSRLSTPKEKYLEASPVTLVTDESPPFLILHGDRDRVVPLVQSRRLRNALRSKEVEVKLVVYKGERHAFNWPRGGEPSPAAKDSWRRTVAFLKRRLLDGPRRKPMWPNRPFSRLKSWVPEPDRASWDRLKPHLARALTEHPALCDEKCDQALRFMPDGEVRMGKTTWEQIAWSCDMAGDLAKKDERVVGAWRLKGGHLELRTADGIWARVDVSFGEPTRSMKETVKTPDSILLNGGPWPGNWAVLYEERRSIEDCTPMIEGGPPEGEE